MTVRVAYVAALAVLALIAGCADDQPAVLDGACVVTAHPLATDVAADVLRDGGNAVDAAVAAAFALAVVEPYSSGLGGGGFFVLHDAATGRQSTLDARETAPAASGRDMFVRDGRAVPDLSETGPLAVAVPSLVKGLAEVHARAGRLPWKRLVEPAMALARDGFPVDETLHRRATFHADRFDAAARAVFVPGGEPVAPGSILRQPDLAATLAAVRDRGAAGFHEGPVAEAVAAAVSAAGGRLTVEDLRDVAPRWREPVSGEFRGRRVVGMPPPSSGGVHVLQLLEFVDGWDWEAFTPADRYHHLAEAMKFVYADRSLWLGDPDFCHVPVARLLSTARIDSLRMLIRADAVLPPERAGGVSAPVPESDHTSHLSVMDAEGNAVAATFTVNLGFGSGMVAAGTGVVLNDEMDDFAAAPGSPNAFGLLGGEANAVAPGKRPLSSMSPTLVLREGRVEAIAGSPGGSRIITATVQTLLNVLVLGFDAEAAVGAPRVHHQWSPPVLYEEDVVLPADVRADLISRGHVFRRREAIGNVQLIVVEGDRPVGASDPRGQGRSAFIPREDILR